MVVAIITRFYPFKEETTYFDCNQAERFGSFKTCFANFEVFYAGY